MSDRSLGKELARLVVEIAKAIPVALVAFTGASLLVAIDFACWRFIVGA